MGALYLIQFDNGKGYVGITRRTAARRMALHRYHAREGRDCALHRALRKYGDAYTVRTLAVASDWSYLCKMECAAIIVFKTHAPDGYNLTPGGEGTGTKWSPETRAKHRARPPVSDETRRKISLARQGFRHTAASKEKIAAAGRGRQFSAERRAKIGATKKGNQYNLGRPCPPERAERIAAAQRGRHFSDEHRRNLSAAHKGKPWSEARRAAQKVR